MAATLLMILMATAGCSIFDGGTNGQSQAGAGNPGPCLEALGWGDCPPNIKTLAAEPKSVSENKPVEIRWELERAEKITIFDAPGVDPNTLDPTSGSQVFTPTTVGDNTYTMTVADKYGRTKTATVKVIVSAAQVGNPPPPQGGGGAPAPGASPSPSPSASETATTTVTTGPAPASFCGTGTVWNGMNCMPVSTATATAVATTTITSMPTRTPATYCGAGTTWNGTKCEIVPASPTATAAPSGAPAAPANSAGFFWGPAGKAPQNIQEAAKILGTDPSLMYVLYPRPGDDTVIGWGVGTTHSELILGQQITINHIPAGTCVDFDPHVTTVTGTTAWSEPLTPLWTRSLMASDGSAKGLKVTIYWTRCLHGDGSFTPLTLTPQGGQQTTPVATATTATAAQGCSTISPSPFVGGNWKFQAMNMWSLTGGSQTIHGAQGWVVQTPGVPGGLGLPAGVSETTDVASAYNVGNCVQGK